MRAPTVETRLDGGQRSGIPARAGVRSSGTDRGYVFIGGSAGTMGGGIAAGFAPGDSNPDNGESAPQHCFLAKQDRPRFTVAVAQCRGRLVRGARSAANSYRRGLGADAAGSGQCVGAAGLLL